jgi:hypothetical protein
MAVVVIALILGTTLDWPDRKIILVGWVIVVAILPFEAVKYVTSSRPRRWLVTEVLAGGGLLGATLLLEHLLL